MRVWFLAFLPALVTLFLAGTAYAEPAEKQPIAVSLLADQSAFKPGGEVTLGVLVKLEPHWHTYWRNPGDSGEAPHIEFSGPAGVEFGAIQFPLPSRITVDGGFAFGYENEVLLTASAKLPKALPTKDVTIDANLSFQICHEDTCVDFKSKVSIRLAVSDNPQPANHSLFAANQAKLPVPLERHPTISRIEQRPGFSGPEPVLFVHWKETPKKVDWFPVATSAVGVEQVKIASAPGATTVSFKPKMYKPDEIPGGKIDSLIVYEDAGGRRHGVTVPVRVVAEK